MSTFLELLFKTDPTVGVQFVDPNMLRINCIPINGTKWADKNEEFSFIARFCHISKFNVTLTVDNHLYTVPSNRLAMFLFCNNHTI